MNGKPQHGVLPTPHITNQHLWLHHAVCPHCSARLVDTGSEWPIQQPFVPLPYPLLCKLVSWALVNKLPLTPLVIHLADTLFFLVMWIFQSVLVSHKNYFPTSPIDARIWNASPCLFSSLFVVYIKMNLPPQITFRHGYQERSSNTDFR